MKEDIKGEVYGLITNDDNYGFIDGWHDGVRDINDGYHSWISEGFHDY